MDTNRLELLSDAMQNAGLDVVALNPGPSLVHLSGLHFHLSERPTVFLYQPDRAPVLILPELEKSKVDPALGVDLFSYGDNPDEWGAVFSRACHHLSLNDKTIGIEPTRLRVLELRYLEGGITHANIQSAESALALVRMRKDSQEISAMKKAVEIAQQALLNTLPMIKAGVTEREAAAELTLQLMRAGSDPDLPFAAVVCGGPNSANPHAMPSDRAFRDADVLVIDWGATFQGYCSDLTRSFCINRLDPEFAKIAGIVEGANQAARNIVKPGVQAGSVDHAAREVIQQAGYGEHFTHRTGHGLGLEVHEHPYIYAENQLLLAPGMTFTIEPGIYINDKGGIRIEDNVVVTQDGNQCLSDLPRGIKILGEGG